jgi:hypothetical protein
MGAVLKRAAVVSAVALALAVPVAAKLLRTPFFNATSRISWTDTTPNPADTIEAIQFALTRQGDDPRTQDESCIRRLITVLAGEKVNLAPLLTGIPVGTYSVFPRATSADGTRKGPWSDPQTVIVDLKEPKSPAGLGRK